MERGEGDEAKGVSSVSFHERGRKLFQSVDLYCTLVSDSTTSMEIYFIATKLQAHVESRNTNKTTATNVNDDFGVGGCVGTFGERGPGGEFFGGGGDFNNTPAAGGGGGGDCS